jgi:hypothetical protein
MSEEQSQPEESTMTVDILRDLKLSAERDIAEAVTKTLRSFTNLTKVEVTSVNVRISCLKSHGVIPANHTVVTGVDIEIKL